MRSAVYSRKRMAPRNDPCGTPIQYSAVQSAPEMKLMIRFEYVLVPAYQVCLEPPSRTAAMRFLAVESRFCGPSCRKLRTNPATPVQVSYRLQWRAECPTELSTRRFRLSGQRVMRTEAVAAGRTCPDISVAAVP